MRRAVGSALFLVVAPGTIVVLIPLRLTHWHAHHIWLPLRVLGGVLIGAGAAVVVRAFARFVVEGRGTPVPVAPPSRLVVTGEYRYVRNPMYFAQLTVILGQALLLGRPILVAYAAAIWLIFATFVFAYEQPALRARFGEQYEAYCRAVPPWLPRLRPWRGG